MEGEEDDFLRDDLSGDDDDDDEVALVGDDVVGFASVEAVVEDFFNADVNGLVFKMLFFASPPPLPPMPPLPTTVPAPTDASFNVSVTN